MIVPFPVGGGADVAARVVAAAARGDLGQSVVVENYGGAGGTIGTAKAAQSAADGYTMFVGTPSTHGTNVAVFPKLSYDPIRDFAPIGLIGTSPFLLIAHPSVPAVVGEGADRAGEEEAGGAQLRLVRQREHQPSRRRAVQLDGEHRRAAHPVPGRRAGACRPDRGPHPVHLRRHGGAAGDPGNGQVRLLGVGSAQRWHVFPDVPTIAESALPGFDLSTWYGLFAPAKHTAAGRQPAECQAERRPAPAAVEGELRQDGLRPGRRRARGAVEESAG